MVAEGERRGWEGQGRWGGTRGSSVQRVIRRACAHEQHEAVCSRRAGPHLEISLARARSLRERSAWKGLAGVLDTLPVKSASS